MSGSLVKLPAGYTAEICSHGSTFRAVVIQGRLRHRASGEASVEALEPGSCVSSNGGSVLTISCGAGEECIIYVRMEGKYDVIPAQPEN